MRKSKHILVIIPTYNEVENIRKIIPAVMKQDPRIEVLVVDDNSPDGTGVVVETMKEENPKLHLIKRAGKQGLGTAYVTGFRWALKQDYDLIMEMDADFSHNPKELPKFFKYAENVDLVIGSRYIHGLNVVNWHFTRLMLSYSANIYTRLVTRLPIKDATSGFKCFRREVLESMDMDAVHSDGYAFQIEMAFKAWKKGFRLKEVPIVFVDRTEGISKMSGSIISEAAWVVWKLLFLSLFGRLK
ncbi:polyprenol monophosphomannose synthase [candidate division KSB1 bacterium]|nr:polyprenol monophosphomannose synthase [candidate division KSB1 bacterium]